MARSRLAVALFGVLVFTLGCGGGGGSGGGGSGGSSPPQAAVVNGSCSTTTVNQCRAGTFADTADSDAEHRWDCRGSGGGTTAMCSLPKPVDGECGAEVNMCRSGDLDDVGDSDADFLWNCDGRHGGQTAMCSLPRPVDGVCGAEVNVCLLGNLDDIDDSDADFLWNCDGRHGGQPAMCSLPKPIDGECGEEVNACLLGNLDDIDDSETEHLWDCDGQHGGITAACSLQKTVVCPNGAPASDNPISCERGNTNFMIPGIDRLPLDRVLLTNEQVQRHFAIVEVTSDHAQSVGVTACESYVTASEGCERHANRAGITEHPEGDETIRTGLIPFTQILDLNSQLEPGEDIFAWRDKQIDAMQDLRILNVSAKLNRSYIARDSCIFCDFSSNLRPFLHIRSASNGSSNHSWFLEDVDGLLRELTATAIAANKLLLVAGMYRNVNGEYIRDPGSSSCKDVDYGCIWTWFHFRYGSGALVGTSLSAPNIAASLASVLSIFPDTEHQDLAKLARACAKKTGEGIDGPNGLLATSGGFGVADFSCMDEIVATAANLSWNETATLTVDGREVTISPRALAVAEAEVELPPAGESVDYGALAALYDATGGPDWLDSAGWLTDAPLGRWHGVRANAENRVGLLHLYSNGLSGRMPAELGGLGALRSLDLSNNQLGGGIPAELGGLGFLEALKLSSNQLSGAIPAELANLGSLGSLDLSRNRLSGRIPAELGGLGTLRSLDLSDNQLGGEIPAELGGLGALRSLDLSDNQLGGEIPAELADLPRLGFLYLGGNQFTGCIPAGLADVWSNDLDELGLPDC